MMNKIAATLDYCCRKEAFLLIFYFTSVEPSRRRDGSSLQFVTLGSRPGEDQQRDSRSNVSLKVIPAAVLGQTARDDTVL